MIIACQKCNKKFEIDSSLIPKKGRLLKCGSCNYEWFFTKQKIENEELEIPIKEIENEELEIPIKEIKNETLDIKPNILENNLNLNQSKTKGNIKKKKISFFKTLIVFILSIISLIVVIDTFKEPISLIIPNIEFLLYNLFETIKDIRLFFDDLF